MDPEFNQNPIRLALIGAGIFARDAHMPALLDLPDFFEIVAIYSRSQKSAMALAASLPHEVPVYTDLLELLANGNIEAVDVLLPIDVMPDVVTMALEAGKHVISEKPIAPTVSGGKALIEAYSSCASQVWMVAENYRYEEAFIRASELVSQQLIGRPLICNWPLQIPMDSRNKYYHTRWRRSGNYPGGLLLDSGVHHVAAMRQVLGEIESVSAIKAQMRSDLAPADTLSASLEFENGAIGSYSVTFASAEPHPTALHIAGERGNLRDTLDKIELTVDGRTDTINLSGGKGVWAELKAFATAIRCGEEHRNPPHQALQDVAVFEAMLRSADINHRVAPENCLTFSVSR